MSDFVYHELIRTKYTIDFVLCYNRGGIKKNLTFEGNSQELVIGNWELGGYLKEIKSININASSGFPIPNP